MSRHPDRALHLVDVENLAGTALPATGQVRQLRAWYAGQVGIGPRDLVVVACSHKGLLPVALGWPGARYRVRSGPDGADLELLDVLDHEDPAGRFARVVIASGDGAFTASAARLAGLGCPVTVVSRRERLAVRLRLAAHDVICPDDRAPVDGGALVHRPGGGQRFGTTGPGQDRGPWTA